MFELQAVGEEGHSAVLMRYNDLVSLHLIEIYIIGDIGQLRFLHLRSRHVLITPQIPLFNGHILAD